MTPGQRKASKAICDAATPGPLRIIEATVKSDGGIDYAIVDHQDQVIAECFERTGLFCHRPARQNAELFVESRAALPAALEHMDEQDKEIERLNEAWLVVQTITEAFDGNLSDSQRAAVAILDGDRTDGE